MTNIKVSVVGSANLGQMQSEFGKLNAEVAALNMQLAKMIDTNKAVDASGYQRLSKAAAYNSKIFRDAAASTGMFEVQQVRLNSATDEYVKKLRAQKMSFRELMRTRKIASAAYKEQLAMENMLVKRGPTSNATGREVFDVVTPKRYSAELDVAGRRVAWFTEQLKSGANQMVNWGKNTQWAGRQLMVGLTMPVAAFGAAAGVMAYQVDAQLTRVRKVYDTTADQTSAATKDMIAVNKELAQVTKDSMDTAIASAKAYGAAATDTISVQAELAATGKTGTDLQKSTMEVMRIARLGEVDTETATNATIALQSVFRDTIKTSDDLSNAFNYMNAIENATSLTTADFAEAIPVAASAVKAWGGDVKELGILLTAMRENGIAASEGANALKATMQRLARPSETVQKQWKELTGTDIVKITENADSLTDVFMQIYEVTKNLSKSDQRKAFAGLFGSYQVSRMMALTKGMGELKDGVGQVSDAYRIAGKDAEEWRTIAENEIKQYQQSISGRFKTALEQLKIQLATMGKPFVKIATDILNGVSKLIDWFNNLPSIVKHVTAWGVALAALAGPIVMLTGLLANLVGNGLKTFAAILSATSKLGTSMQILDKENRIAVKSAELMNKGYQSQAAAAANLTVEIKKLAAAQAQANEATQLAAATPVVTRKTKSLMAREAREAEHARLQQHMNMWLMADTTGTARYREDNGKFIAASEVERRARASIAAEDAKIAEESAKTTESTEKTRKNLAGAAVAGHALAAGMALTMFSSNETANHVGDMLIMGSIVLPSAIMLGAALKKAAVWMKEAKVAALALAAAEKVGAMYAGIGAAASGRWKAGLAASAAAGGGLKGALAFIPGLLTPMGLISTAVVGIGAGIFMWQRHLQKVKEEQAELHIALNNMTDVWAEKVGLVKQEYQGIADVQGKIVKQSQYDKFLEAYNSGDFKKQRDALANPDLSEAERMNAIVDHFASLQADYGLSSEKAAIAIKALGESIGLSGTKTLEIIRQLKKEVGDIDMGSGKQFQIQANVFFNQEQYSKEAEDAAKDAGQAFSNEFNSVVGDPTKSAALMQTLRDEVNKGWESAWQDLSTASSTPLVQAIQKMGVETGAQLRRAIGEAGGNENFIDQLFPNADVATKSNLMMQLGEAVRGATTNEQLLVSEIAKGVEGIDDSTNSVYALNEATGAFAAQAQQVSFDKMRSLLDVLAGPQMPQTLLDSILPGMEGIDKAVYGASESEKLAYANALLLTHGLSQATSVAEAVAIASGKIAPEIATATNEAHRLDSALSSISPSQALQAVQDSMGAVQQQMADDASEAFDQMQSDQMDATQNFWDHKVDAVASAGERAKAALDKAWERRTDAADKYWEHRIELVDKAIKAEQDAEEKRKKMFDAEIARITKLNEMANANIDFNVALNEGKLDEAAKLRNDLQAKADSEAIGRAQASAEERSARRVEKLEKKKERLEKARDAAMEALRKQEEAQKASLDRQVEANKKAVEQQRDDHIAALQAKQDADKKNMDEMIKLFMAGTAASKAELKQRLDDAGISYQWFEDHVIKPKGLKWGQYFGDKLQTELKISAQEIASDNMWEAMGAKALEGLAKGMGFSGRESLMHFLRTGEIKNFAGDKAAATTTPTPGKDPSNGGKTPETRHAGGEIGGAGSSRKGVARTRQGLSPQEQYVRALKGEFMVNKEAYQKNKGVVEAINNGANFDKKEEARVNRIKNGKGGPGQGPAPFFAAAFTRAVAQRVGKNLATAVANKKAQQAAYMGGAFGSIGAGQYGDISFNAEQLGNARIIAEVGKSMGMSARDIEIGIMTAITESSLRNVQYGDRDSLGLFQQRPSQGWGTAAQVTDPRYAAGKFFSVLKGVDGRAAMAPWLAAQAVQRSAFSDGSNYRQYWNEAEAIWKAMQNVSASTGGTGGRDPYGGPGGPASGSRWKASIPGRGWGNSHDYHNPLHSPIFAIGPGYVTARTFPPSAGSGEHPNAYPRGYGSYGVQALFRGDDGVTFSAAHLWPGSVVTGRVRGGQQIAQSAATGNASGPHTHFEVNGSTNAQGLFASLGIPLKKGASMVRFDNTLANLHHGEAVLTKDLNEKFHRGVDRFANGGGDEYTVIVNPSEGMDEERLANKVVRKLEQKAGRRPINRTVGKKR